MALPLIAFVASRCDSGSTHVQATLDGGTRADGAATDGSDEGGGDIVSDSGGALAYQDEPDTPCLPRGGSTVQLYAPGPGAPAFDRTGHAGGRRWAQGTDAIGFVTFDEGGGSPSALVTPFSRSNLVVPFGDGLLSAGSDGTNLLVRQFDANGSPTGAPAPVATDESTGLALSSAGNKAVVLWGTANGLRVRGITAGGAFASDVFTPHAAPALEFGAAVAPDADGNFAIVWTGSAGPGIYATYFLKTGLTERVQKVTLLARGKQIRPVQLVHHTKGFGLLLDTANGTALVAMNEDGVLLGRARVLLGTSRGFGIGTSNGELGVLAWRLKQNGPDAEVPTSHDAIEFRPFAADGSPLGNWVCLDGPSRDSSIAAAIEGEANGYAVVYRTPAGGVAFTRFDRRGTGNP